MNHILYIITRSDTIGGAQVHVRDMSLYCLKKGFKVSVIVGGNGIYIDHLIKLGIDVYSIKELKREINLFSDLKVLPLIYKLIKKLSPSVISIHSTKVGILIRTLKIIFNLPPCIFTAHGWSFVAKVSTLRKITYLYLEKLMSFGTTILITICKSDYNLALKNRLIPKKKIRLIYNGMPFLEETKREIKPIDHKYKLISVARFETQKDHKTLVKALSLIKNFSWELFLVGDGPLKKKTQKLVSHYKMEDRIFFLGTRNDIADLLNKSDIFILSSLWEGFPRSILEALRASLPVITSKVGGVEESVINQHNGLIIPIKDEQTMSIAIKELLNNPTKCYKFGINGRKMYEKKYVFDLMSEKTFKIYSQLIQKQ